MWGFLCPICLFHQGRTYSRDLKRSSSSSSSSSSSENALTESQLERYPPWSCHGLDHSDFSWTLFFCCCCLFGFLVAGARHDRYSERDHYCSSQPCYCCCCCCDDDISIENCLIAHFCCCCSVIQITMADDERFRMRSKVEGNVNIKHAH